MLNMNRNTSQKSSAAEVLVRNSSSQSSSAKQRYEAQQGRKMLQWRQRHAGFIHIHKKNIYIYILITQITHHTLFAITVVKSSAAADLQLPQRARRANPNESRSIVSWILGEDVTRGPSRRGPWACVRMCSAYSAVPNTTRAKISPVLAIFHVSRGTFEGFGDVSEHPGRGIRQLRGDRRNIFEVSAKTTGTIPASRTLNLFPYYWIWAELVRVWGGEGAYYAPKRTPAKPDLGIVGQRPYSLRASRSLPGERRGQSKGVGHRLFPSSRGTGSITSLWCLTHSGVLNPE